MNVNKSFQVEESCKGVIRYALSDRTFIDKGWTMLPTEKVVRKVFSRVVFFCINGGLTLNHRLALYY